MKKFFSLIIIIISFIFIASCSKNTVSGKYEIALITEGTIDDKAFNQGAWEGLTQYAKENGKTYKYYQPAQKTTEGYIDSIDLAVSAGAQLIITPNYLFETAIYKSQDNHPDVSFVILDGVPQDGTYTDFRIEKNVYSVLYAEEQAGFLAGYAIVKEGYTNLGVIGGMAIPPVIRFGYGFVQGANYAADEMNMPIGSIKINYTYIGNFNAAPENQTLATSWYQSGVQVIFAAAGAAGNSVMSAAEQNNGLVIGVDVDQSFESPTVITSAIKLIRESVYNAVDSFYNGKFPGGQSVILDAKVKGIGLPMAASKFQKFTQNDYDTIYNPLSNGSIKILKDTDAKTVEDLPLDIIEINYIK
ncbi:basic membrane lipoprotein [Brachyspira hampsonii 30446]|uniref:Basic membrane lipoprotein n=3 Tax=Brachyspira hampsonii TaxID=1287055 RepID=A0A2U4EWD6_9SPIR|nr:BMP family ABC transporter substrate-binding protein [Brachyspira hampsonii]EKV57316.1 basic membrane lipoprotein [Brachyspira hampsonii 30446]OEJ18555.1 BMP family ABC transporter substrate-binding protein [Brachyspira hampsonii]